MNKYIRLLTILPIFCFSLFGYTHDLETAIASNERTHNYASRDEYRNPLETLTFFGIESDMKIVEKVNVSKGFLYSSLEA